MRKKTSRGGWGREFRGKAGAGDRLGTLFGSRGGHNRIKHFNNCIAIKERL